MYHHNYCNVLVLGYFQFNEPPGQSGSQSSYSYYHCEYVHSIFSNPYDKASFLLAPSSSPIETPPVGVNEELILSIVKRELLKYSADQIERFDYALENAGGKVVGHSDTYDLSSSRVTLLGIPLPIPVSRLSPDAVIQVNVHVHVYSYSFCLAQCVSWGLLVLCWQARIYCYQSMSMYMYMYVYLLLVVYMCVSLSLSPFSSATI